MKYLHILLLAVVLAACSNDDTDMTSTVETMRLQLPNIELVMEQTENTMEQTENAATRSGDPGYDDALELPNHVYIFMWLKQRDSNYMLYYIHRDNVTRKWVERTDLDKPDNRRYELENEGDYTIATNAVSTDAGAIGKWYVLASNKGLSDTEINTIYPGLATESATIIGEPTLKDIEANPGDKIKAAELDLSSWLPADLRDLYSNPIGDTEVDDKGYLNGEIKIGVYTDGGITQTGVLHGDVRLYHVAAKIDFKWEVPTNLQETTSVKQITVTGLPTKCKIFEPTSNPTTATTSHTITTDAGNKWSGREYFYALEPSSKQITYKVEFNGTKADVEKTTPYPAVPSDVFTGWYRINAKVQ